MLKKTLSSLSVVASVLVVSALSEPASACADTSGQWDCIHDGTGTYPTSATGIAYQGSATLSHWYTGTLWCNDVRAEGDIDISGGSVTVTITSFNAANSTSSARCANVTFGNFDWIASHDGTGSPSSSTDTTSVSTTFHTPEVTYSGTQVCYDSVPASFRNDGSGGSLFDYDTTISGWAGTCHVNGTLYNSSISVH